MVSADDVIRAAINHLDAIAPGLAGRLRWQRWRRRGKDECRVIDAFVERGDVVVDVGASRGDFALHLAQRVGRNGTAHCVEPNPEHRGRLERLSRCCPNLRVHVMAASNRQGDAQLLIPAFGGRRRPGLASLKHTPHLDQGGEQVTVPVATLDSIVGGDASRVAFVKCDVEGHELAALQGAPRLLAHRPTLLVEIEQRHHSSPVHEIFDFLARTGYECWALFPDGLKPFAQFDIERDQIAFVTGEPQESMPRGYVNNFLFVATGRPLPGSLRH